MLAAIGVDGVFTNRPDRFLPPAKNGLIVPGGDR
ncbi:TPA: glycerophosphodiester phosphodiesterase, partial [Aeromonas hydrophila]|nr:glycerophosphodiester phosphodiesterase [Aeromonas hydrophila]